MIKNLLYEKIIFSAVLIGAMGTLYSSQDAQTQKKSSTEQKSEKSDTDTNSNDSKEFQIELPINVLNERRVHLSLTIPKSFRSVYSMDKFDKGILEFISTSDRSPDCFTQIITVNPFFGKCLSASVFVEKLKQQLFKDDSSVKILKADTKSHGDYTESSFSIKYTHRGRKEIMFAHYYSGPCDCVGFQYTIALTNDMNRAKAKKIIEEFIKNNVAVIRQKDTGRKIEKKACSLCKKLAENKERCPSCDAFYCGKACIERDLKNHKEVCQKMTVCCVCSEPTKTCCSGCKTIFYCSKDCQKKDWKEHKEVCKKRALAKNMFNLTQNH